MPDFNPLSIIEDIMKKRHAGDLCLNGAQKCLFDCRLVKKKSQLLKNVATDQRALLSHIASP
jgi:hypothetical protein